MATAGSSSSNSNSEMVPNRIFVGGIPLDASLSEFEQCIHNVSDPTHIIDINIVNDQQGQSKGFGFVTFDSQVSAARMLAQSKDLTIRDSKLNVAHAFKRLKPYTTRLQPVRIQTDFGAYQFGGGERREYRNGSFKSPNNYQKPVTPAPSSSDDSSTPATHTTTETDVWHSSVSSITKDAPTAMSESSSIGAALCCVVDGNEATNQPTTDRNNNHTLVDKDVGLPIPVHNKDKTADSSSSLASSAPTRFIVPNTQQQQHNNTFTQRKHPGSRNYKYTNGAQINGGRYRSNTFNLHGEQYGNSSNKQQQQELVYHISPRGGNNGGANGNKASYYHQYNNLIQQQYQQQFAMLAAAQQQQQPQTESAKQQPAPIPKEPTVVLAANVNNLTGSARSRVERSRYNGPTSPAAHAAMQISHAASINSAQTFTPPPAPTTNTSNTPPIATNTTHNLAPIHMTYQPQQPSQMSPYNAAAAAAYHHPFYFNPSTGLYVDAAAASRHVTHMGPMSAGSQPHQHHQHPSFYTPNPTHHHHQQQQNHSTLEQLDDMMRKANLNNAAAHMARANNQSQQPPQQQQQQIVNTQYNGNYATNEQKLIWSVGNQAEMMSSNQATAISQQLVQQQQQQQQQQQLQLSTSAPTAPTVLHPTTYYYLSQYPAPPTNYPMYNQTAPSAAATANSNIAAAAQYYYYATAASQLGFANPTTLPQQQQHHIIVNNPNSNTLYSNLHVNPTMMPQQQQQQYFSPTLPSPNQSQVQSQSVADQSQQQQQPQSTAPISVMITNGSANSTALLTPNSSHSSSSQHFATQINGPQHQQQSQPQTPSNLLTPESTPQPITSSSSSTLVNQLSPIQDLSVQPPQQTERVQEEPEITQEQQPIQQQPQPQPPMRQQHYQRTESLSKPGGYQQYYDNRSNRNNNSYQNKTGGAYKPRPGGYRHQQQQQQQQSNPIYRNGGSTKDN